MRIAYAEAENLLQQILCSEGFSAPDAILSAKLFCDANRDGVQSHGLARFPNLIAAIRDRRVIPTVIPEMIWSGGALERWNGKKGPGNLNAWRSMKRAMELAAEYGMGCVALSDTNHWMRGGNFGWQAAEAGYVGICWTNTMPNLPPWGSAHPLIGNNPLVMAVPGGDSGPVVLDMAMSQFSWGSLSQYSSENRILPVPGGYDSEGEITSDASAIEESMRPLPAGFWKGSGLSILLDLMAALLSGGRATCDIAPDAGSETGISQIFIAFNPPGHPGLTEKVLESLKVHGEALLYPGERSLRNRKESEKIGIPVNPEVWRTILEIAGIEVSSELQ